MRNDSMEWKIAYCDSSVKAWSEKKAKMMMMIMDKLKR